MWVQIFPRKLKPLSNTEHRIFMVTSHTIPSRGRKWQLLKSHPYYGLQQFEKLKTLPTQAKLQWKYVLGHAGRNFSKTLQSFP